MLILPCIDAAETIDHPLDCPEPGVRAVVYAHEIYAERFRDQQHAQAIQQYLKPAVERHGFVSEPFGAEQGVNEVDEDSDGEKPGNPVLDAHIVSLLERSASASRPRRSHAAT